MVNNLIPQWGSFQKPSQSRQSLETQNLEDKYKEEVPGQIQDKMTPEGQKPQWGNFQSPSTYQGDIDSGEEEGIFNYLLRNTTANASRLSEQFLGRYGNLEKFAKDTLTNFPQTGGIISWGLSELLGKEKWEQLVKGPPGSQQILPTSNQLRNISENISNGYTKPKTKGEKRFQGFTEDVGAVLSSPANRAIQYRNPIIQKSINSLLIPAAANATKNVVQDLGFGEDKANLAKMAIWLPLSLYANVNAPVYASQLMNQGRNGLPNTLQANVPRLTQRLDAVQRSPFLLNSDPRTALARQTLNGIRQDLANGQNNAQSLLTMYDGINAAKRNRGMFDLNRADQAFARRSINAVRDAVRDEIMDVGANYPQALQDWQNGVRAWATIHQSRAITNWIEGIAKGPYAKLLSGPAAALFGIGTYGAAKTLPGFISAGGALAVPALYKTGQVLYRMWNDPTLANYYWRAISAVQNENATAFINNYQKLDSKLKSKISEEEKDKKRQK